MVAQQGGSDLHLSVGRPPIIRIDGKLYPISGEKKLTAEETKDAAEVVLNEEQKVRLQKDKQIDFSFDLEGKARFPG